MKKFKVRAFDRSTETFSVKELTINEIVENPFGLRIEDVDAIFAKEIKNLTDLKIAGAVFSDTGSEGV